MGRLHAEDEKERPVPAVVPQVRDGHVGQRVGLVARHARGVHVAVPVVESLERRVVHLESVPVLETAPVKFRCARRGFEVIVARISPHLRGDLVAHRPAVPLSEIGGMVAGFAKQGRRARRRRLVHVVEPLHRSGMGMAARENGAPRRCAYGTVGPGAHETCALRGHAVHVGGPQVGVPRVAHGLARVFVGQDVDDVRSGHVPDLLRDR